MTAPHPPTSPGRRFLYENGLSLTFVTKQWKKKPANRHPPVILNSFNKQVAYRPEDGRSLQLPAH